MLRLIIAFVAVVLILSPSRAAADPDSAFQEFLAGHRTTFSSEGHPKAKGANFTIAYPSSWWAAESERPNTLHTFLDQSEGSSAGFVIVTAALPVPDGASISNDELRDVFSPLALQGMLPSNAAFVHAEPTSIEGEPAGILEYTMAFHDAGRLLRVWSICFLTNGTLVQVQFCVDGPAGSETELAGQMATHKPLFRLIANSIVLPEKWTSAGATVAPPAEGGGQRGAGGYGGPPLIPTLLGIIGIWSIGLAPGVLIRYFARRPLRKRIAFLIAGGVSALFWLASTPADVPIGQKLGVGIHWFLMFFVSGWIMSRGATARAPQAGTTGESVAADPKPSRKAA